MKIYSRWCVNGKSRKILCILLILSKKPLWLNDCVGDSSPRERAKGPLSGRVRTTNIISNKLTRGDFGNLSADVYLDAISLLRCLEIQRRGPVDLVPLPGTHVNAVVSKVAMFD
jgi:hypothetical protein